MNDDSSHFWSVRRAERATAAHALGSKLAHDLGTPLNVILGRASLIADDPDASDDFRAHAEVIAKQARTLHEMVTAFIGAVRKPYEGTTGAHGPLLPVARAAIDEVSSLAAAREVTIDLTHEDGAAARLEPVLAGHAVSALLGHVIGLAQATITVSIDVVQVERPQARRCAPGRYGRFVVEAVTAGEGSPEGGDPEGGDPEGGDPDLALAACEGALRVLGGYLAAEHSGGRLHFEACLPTR